jgi:ATP-dependent helicase HepA
VSEETLQPGAKVRYLPRPDWGIGHLVGLDEDGHRALVFFSGEDEPTVVSTKGGALVHHRFAPGDRVLTDDGSAAVIVEQLPPEPKRRRDPWEDEEAIDASRYHRYRISLAAPHAADATLVPAAAGAVDEEHAVDERVLRAPPPSPDLLDMLAEGRVADARAFLLRRRALRLDDERRSDALGALFASRVMPMPHQVGVVQRVLSARRPRFVLADEVGLGKTIESGMVFSALRLAGLARRVLVVAPSHLTVQWLVELFHKFNRLFTLMDGERYAAARKEDETRSPWARFDLVVTSLELLSRDARHRAEIAAADAAWDLVIVDEAHHLRGEKAFEAARALAGNAWGLLLLTATPMQLDPEEYHRLLTLVDPETAPSLADLEARLERQEAISAAVRALLEGGDADAAVADLARRFPGDPVLAGAGETKETGALLTHLAETYSLSEHLVRNRRATVGGFAPRRLHRHRVTPVEKEQAARTQILDRLREAGGLGGAPLARMVRHLESSPAALKAAVSGTKALAGLGGLAELPDRDAKLETFLEVVAGIREGEAGAKILVFTEARATLDFLVEILGREGVAALGYHGDLSLVERDRRVARFRDPDGPAVLVSTEVGGEGRNFQFCHHLVHYDLPWSPAAVEQRIGRLDRIGQARTVEIHVLATEGSLSADVLKLLETSVGVFEETVGGLDAVLEEVEPRLLDLALEPPSARAAYAAELARRVTEARARVRRAYDPLLDLRSADRPGVTALVARAHRRFDLEDGAEDPEADLRDALWGVARDLDERLEETVTEIARKVGLGVDLDEHVEAFQCAFTFGHALTVEALPGLDITRERTELGTFWRDTAIAHEEIDYFATGHPIVEALLGFLRDGPFGRAAFRLVPVRQKRGVAARQAVPGVELIFHLEPPEPEDTSPGARIPSRQLARFLEDRLVQVAIVRAPDGSARVDGTALAHLATEEGESLRGDQIMDAFPGFGDFVPRAVSAAEAAAEAALAERAATARAAIEAEAQAAAARLTLALSHQGVSKAAATARLDAVTAHYSGLLEALGGVRPVLDSACGFVLVPA